MIKTSKLVAVMTTFNEQVTSVIEDLDNNIDILNEREGDINEEVVFYLKAKSSYNILEALFAALRQQTGGFPETIEKVINNLEQHYDGNE